MAQPYRNRWWGELNLPGQFLLAGACVMLMAMILVGNWVSQRIRDSVVDNSAAASAMFMESLVSPLTLELASPEGLSPPAHQALSEIFAGTTLGNQMIFYRIWLPNGSVAHSSVPGEVGRIFRSIEPLDRAWTGEIAATYHDGSGLDGGGPDYPVLRVFSPVRAAWTGAVVAVVEFHERADDVAEDVANARRTAWLVVGGAFLASGLLLFWIVQAGGRTIRQQREALERQLAETEHMSRQNEDLRQRAVSASARATAQTDRAIRRLGFDLHDGPAQYIALAALRLDSALGRANGASADAAQVRGSLDRALEELRILSRGLALPDLDETRLYALAERVVRDHEAQTGMSVDLSLPRDPEPPLDYARKLCVYRFLQEALSNVARHAETDVAWVTISLDPDLCVEVRDKGAGFDAAQARGIRQDGGQGLYGLIDRAESIGGSIIIDSETGAGSTLKLCLPVQENA